MAEVIETKLPGIGVRYDFRTASGTPVGVLVHRSGRRDLLVYSKKDAAAAEMTLGLDADDSRTLAELLGASRVAERLAAVQQDIEGLTIDWIRIEPGAEWAGQSLSGAGVHTITGVSIVAIVVATGDERTALADHEPGPKHSRGYATEQAIHANGQLSFEFGTLIHVTQAGQAAGLGALRTWLLLYYAAAGAFQVELSLPEAIEGGRITRWTERILLPAIPRQPRKPVGVGPRMHQLLLR